MWCSFGHTDRYVPFQSNHAYTRSIPRQEALPPLRLLHSIQSILDSCSTSICPLQDRSPPTNSSQTKYSLRSEQMSSQSSQPSSAAHNWVSQGARRPSEKTQGARCCSGRGRCGEAVWWTVKHDETPSMRKVLQNAIHGSYVLSEELELPDSLPGGRRRRRYGTLC